MKIALLFFAAMQLAAQTVTISPNADFNLGANVKRPSRRAGRVALSADSNGLTLVTFGEHVFIVSADSDGRIRYTTPDLKYLREPVYWGFPLTGGGAWLASSKSHREFESHPAPGFEPTHQSSTGESVTEELDRYGANGDVQASIRFLSSPSFNRTSVLAATADRLVLQSVIGRTGLGSEVLRFGRVQDGQFLEEAQVHLNPPVPGAIAILGSDGKLYLVERHSGNLLIVDPVTKVGAVKVAQRPAEVIAGGIDGGNLYLLSRTGVSKCDLDGRVASVYNLEWGAEFVPSEIATSASHLFVADRRGRVERFDMLP